jgi:hypothetical protein
MPLSLCLQSLKDRIFYPRGFNRNYRCAVKHCDGYTMEEYANTLVIGPLIAKIGPNGLKKLWRHVAGFAPHYLYNFHPTDEEKCKAAGHLRAYAEELENFVLQDKVRTLRAGSSSNIYCSGV